MPDSTIPPNVPAPPMLAMPTIGLAISFRCKAWAPTRGPITAAAKATGATAG